jgi:hypothetical protein
MIALIAALALFGKGAALSTPMIEQRPQPKPAPKNQQGYGDLAIKDARTTVHFVAKTPDGSTVADTETRGMAFTFLMDQESFWSDAVRGMRVGGVKTVSAKASTVGVVLPNDPSLAITIRLLKVAPLT